MEFAALSAFSIFAALSRRIRRLYATIAPVLLLLFIALAYSSGYDWIGYFGFFNCYQFDICETSALSIEPGFVALLDVRTPFGYQFVVMVAGLLITGSLIYFRRESQATAFVYAYFILMYGWYLYIEQLRQGMALSVILIGIPALLKGDQRKYVVCVLVGMLFHISALIGLAPLLFRRLSERNAERLMLAMTAVFVATALLLVPLAALVSATPLAGTLVADKLNFYAASENYNRSFAGVGFIFDLMFYFFIVFARPGKEMDERARRVYLLAQLFFLLLLASRLNTILFRVTYYFAPFVALYLDRFVKAATTRRPYGSLRFRLPQLHLLVVVLYLLVQNSRPFLDPVIGPSIFEYRWWPVHGLYRGEDRYDLALSQCDTLQDKGVGFLCGRW
jgi:hypothetical protein